MPSSAPTLALVTGGAGFVGTHLIRALLDRYPDLRVVSLDNYFTGTTDNHVDDPRATYLTGSTVDVHKIWQNHGLGRPDVVFHLGEYSRIVASFSDFEETWEFNTRGTKEVVTFCHSHSCKLVYAGSSSKFGNGGRDEHLNPYAWTKSKNIEFITDFAEWYGLDHVITYFYNVYGPGHVRTGKYATVIGIFEDQYERGEPLTVVSPGTQTRDFTHVADIVDGILRCYQGGSGDGYMLGAGREYSILQVAELFGTPHVLVPKLRGERERGQADASKVKALGWEPTHALADYIAEFTRTHTPGGLSR